MNTSNEKDYEEFKDNLLEGLKALDIGNAIPRLRTVTKNNRVEIDTIVFSTKDSKISPIIYLPIFYECYKNGMGISEIIREIAGLYHENKIGPEFDCGCFLDFKEAGKRIMPELVNYALNKKMLENVPHKRMLDLAIVFRYMVDEENNASILVNNTHAHIWDVSADELYDLSIINGMETEPYEITRLEDMLSELLGENMNNEKPKKLDRDRETIFVLTNKSRLYGASCILYQGLLETISEQLGSNFYIIPSSIHELLLIPENNIYEVKRFVNIVKEVNTEHLEPVDILSDHLYYYNYRNDCIEVV